MISTDRFIDNFPLGIVGENTTASQISGRDSQFLLENKIALLYFPIGIVDKITKVPEESDPGNNDMLKKETKIRIGDVLTIGKNWKK